MTLYSEKSLSQDVLGASCLVLLGEWRVWELGLVFLVFSVMSPGEEWLTVTLGAAYRLLGFSSADHE